MTLIILAVILFGFVHPGSKLLLDTGIPLEYFCLAYVGIRIVLLLPVVLKKNLLLVSQKSHFLWLVVFGLIGASLQYFEFKGVEQGLPPETVTFITYSYPVWILVYELLLKRNFDGLQIFKIGAIATGMLLVTESSLESLGNWVVVYPLIASISIAAWIGMTKFLRSLGLSSLTLSIYYDVFAFIALCLFLEGNIRGNYGAFVGWMSVENWTWMVLYSVVIGLLPNIFFYEGSKKVTAYVSGGLMTFEPVFSTIYSALLFGVLMSVSFVTGSALILIGNMPLDEWLKSGSKK